MQVASIPGDALLDAIYHVAGDIEAVLVVHVNASETPQGAEEPKQESDAGTAGPRHNYLGAFKDARAYRLEPSATQVRWQTINIRNKRAHL